MTCVINKIFCALHDQFGTICINYECILLCLSCVVSVSFKLTLYLLYAVTFITLVHVGKKSSIIRLIIYCHIQLRPFNEILFNSFTLTLLYLSLPLCLTPAYCVLQFRILVNILFLGGYSCLHLNSHSRNCVHIS